MDLLFAGNSVGPHEGTGQAGTACGAGDKLKEGRERDGAEGLLRHTFFLLLRKTSSPCFSEIPRGWEQASKPELWGLVRGIPGRCGAALEGWKEGNAALGPGPDTAAPKGSDGSSGRHKV